MWVALPSSGEMIRVCEGGDVVDTITTGRMAIACALGGADRKTLFMLTAASGVPEDCRARSHTAQVLATEVDVAGASIGLSWALFGQSGVFVEGMSLSTRTSCGRPSTRSAMMLRRISSVPPAMRIAASQFHEYSTLPQSAPNSGGGEDCHLRSSGPSRDSSPALPPARQRRPW